MPWNTRGGVVGVLLSIGLLLYTVIPVFHRDGFLIIEEGFLDDAAIHVLRKRFAALFDGEYATGIAPDEVNWKAHNYQHLMEQPTIFYAIVLTLAAATAYAAFWVLRRRTP